MVESMREANMARAQTISADEDWRRITTISFGGTAVKAPKGFSDLTVDENISVTITGTIVGLSSDRNGDELRIRVKDCKLETK